MWVEVIMSGIDKSGIVYSLVLDWEKLNSLVTKENKQVVTIWISVKSTVHIIIATFSGHFIYL